MKFEIKLHNLITSFFLSCGGKVTLVSPMVWWVTNILVVIFTSWWAFLKSFTRNNVFFRNVKQKRELEIAILFVSHILKDTLRVKGVGKLKVQLNKNEQTSTIQVFLKIG